MRTGEAWREFANRWVDAARDEPHMWIIPDEDCGHTVSERFVAGVIADAAVAGGIVSPPSKTEILCSACVVARLRDGGALAQIIGQRRVRGV